MSGSRWRLAAPVNPAEGSDQVTTIVLLAVAAVLLVLYLGRRRARLRREESEHI